MGKRKKRRHQHKSQLSRSTERGLELGQTPRVLIAPESAFSFQEALHDSDITGCAYGFDHVDGYPTYVPCVTIIGMHADKIRRAFECFESWGSQVDGEAVDLEMLLCNDGTYLFGIGPNARRMISRLVCDQALANVLFPGTTFIKTIDSTNPILLEWKENSTSKMFPVKIMGATASLTGGIPDMNSIKVVEGANPFVTFNLKIVSEAEAPDHFFLRVIRQQRQIGEKKKVVGDKPAEIALARKNLIDSVFPVSKARIRRANIVGEVRASLSDCQISDSQIEQAVINLILSREIGSGTDHFVTLPDIHQKWHEYLRTRVETTAMVDDIPSISLTSILKQLELDVAFTLRSHGAQVKQKFSTNQRLFMRLGYGEH